MKKNTNNLILFLNDNFHFHAVFRNNSGRVVYLDIFKMKYLMVIDECRFIDQDEPSRPEKLKTRICEPQRLVDVIDKELDRKFDKIKVCVDAMFSKDELISEFLETEKIECSCSTNMGMKKQL